MPDRRWFWGLVALAVAARVAAVLALQSHLVPHSTFEHGEIAANLLAGRGFSVEFLGADGPTSQQAPLYPLLVAVAYAIGGVGTPRGLLLLELGQALLGGWLVAETIRLARSVAPGRPWVGDRRRPDRGRPSDARLRRDPRPGRRARRDLLVATLARAYEARTRARRLRCRSLAGRPELTDPILGLVAPAAWLGDGAIGRGRLATFVRTAGCSRSMALAAILGISPWVVRNAVVHGEFVPIKSTFGYAFWQGNCRQSQGTDKVVRASVETALNRDSAEPARPRMRSPLGRAARGGIHRRHRADPRPITGSSVPSPSPSGRASSSAAPCIELKGHGPDVTSRSACGGSATSSSSTRRTRRRGTGSTGSATSG